MINQQPTTYTTNGNAIGKQAIALIRWPFTNRLSSPIWLALRLYIAWIWFQMSMGKFQANWLTSDAALGRFDLIIGSDVLYERALAQQLSRFIDEHLEADGRVVLVDPNRGERAHFSRDHLPQNSRRLACLTELLLGAAYRPPADFDATVVTRAMVEEQAAHLSLNRVRPGADVRGRKTKDAKAGVDQ